MSEARGKHFKIILLFLNENFDFDRSTGHQEPKTK